MGLYDVGVNDKSELVCLGTRRARNSCGSAFRYTAYCWNNPNRHLSTAATNIIPVTGHQTVVFLKQILTATDLPPSPHGGDRHLRLFSPKSVLANFVPTFTSH
jgi:hypothetical protein